MGIKIKLNAELCQGHARCMRKGPHVYRLNEKGFLDTVPVTLPTEWESEAIAGADACPELAITIMED